VDGLIWAVSGSSAAAKWSERVSPVKSSGLWLARARHTIALGSAQNKEEWNRLILGKINLPQHFATSNLAS
jgi:hypothetical protein